MEKQEIIKRFLKEGILLEPETVKKINERNIDEYIKKLKQGESTTKISIQTKKPQVKEKISPKDFIDFYNNKYEGIKKLLSRKMEAVSINKTKKLFSSVGIIGMVKEIGEKSLILEDPTGEISVIFSNEISGIEIDDVIGVKGDIRENKIFAESLMLPDIPLNNDVKRMSLEIVLTEKITEEIKKLKDVNLILTTQEGNGRIVVVNANPTWVRISTGGKEVTILAYRPKKDIEPKEVLEWLVKRHLPVKIGKITSPEDLFLLDPIPDIFWLLTNKKWAKVYKGVTTISCGSGNFAKINLRTREVIFGKI